MIVDNYLRLDKDELSNREWFALFKKMQYVDAQQNVYKPWKISSKTGRVILPRGAWNLLPDRIEYVDKRAFPDAKLHEFTVKLDATEIDPRFARQSEAVEEMFTEEQGQVLRPPGSGKTQVLLAFIAKCPTRCLVLVNTEDILNQWREYAKRACPAMPIGVIRGQEISIQRLTIATVQTFSKLAAYDRHYWRDQFGCIISDECHHAPAVTFETCLNLSAAKYRFGATASATRADGRHPYMKLVLGPVIHRQAFSSPIPVKVIPVKTDFKFHYKGRHDWGRMLTALIRDEKRNKRIARIADREIGKGNSILILSRRVEHLENIYELMERKEDAEVLAAQLKKKPERQQIIQDFKDGKLLCVLATQLADEALDVPILSRVVLTHPGKHSGRIVQQVGRALRKTETKERAVIYDVADTRVRSLNRQWMLRKKAYRAMKIPIQLRSAKKWH